MNDIREDPDTKEWIPHAGVNWYCKVCGKSHEAEEFFSSLLDIAVAEFIISKGFIELLKRNRFAEEDSLEVTEGYTGVQAAEHRVSKER